MLPFVLVVYRIRRPSQDSWLRGPFRAVLASATLVPKNQGVPADRAHPDRKEEDFLPIRMRVDRYRLFETYSSGIGRHLR
jgi:hypothetical protein